MVKHSLSNNRSNIHYSKASKTFIIKQPLESFIIKQPVESSHIKLTLWLSNNVDRKHRTKI